MLFSALIDYRTNIVLTVSNWDPGITLLTECIPDSMRLYNATHPNYRDSFFLAALKPHEYPRWTWDFGTRSFKESPKHLITPSVEKNAALATAKLSAFITIAFGLNKIRSGFATGLLFQETIYLAKKLQAQSFRDNGYKDETILEYPYVLQYADNAHISFRQAADDIIFKAKLGDELLSKTEFLRIMYYDKIKYAKDQDEITAIVKKFTGDRIVNTTA